MNHFKKSMLAAVVTLSTASVFYAQQDTASRSKDIEQVVLTGVADIAKERKTPVAVSTIKEAQIVEKLGNQEFPEILNTTPSVYATKSGGGFGDGKMIIRGFDQTNIAVMINGVPVNDMENGAVYWSNWAGLSDVTSAMQVQRGLGASKLAIASVGGTVNVVTRAADKKRGALVSIGVGNNGYHKALFAYNSGKNSNGWSTSFLTSRTAGAMYADGTDFEGYNYYFALGYQKPSSNHDFQFTITGAPQWHNQRYTYNTIATYLDMGDGLLDKKYASDPDRTYNADWGYLNGEQFNFRRNFYHKPVMSLNWDWKISNSSKLNTVAYASFGRGGGSGDLGGFWNGKFNSLTASSGAGQPTIVFPSGLPRTSDGLIRIDDIVRYNSGGAVSDFGPGRTSTIGGDSRTVINPANNKSYTATEGIIRRASINSHNWFGLISSFNHKINDVLNFTVGIDGRYYYGYHYQVATDLMGNTAYKDSNNKNLGAPDAKNVYVVQPNVVSTTYAPDANWNPFGGKLAPMKDRIGYSNDGEVLWYGGFGQLEYSNDNLSAFIQGAVSNQAFQRIDNFIVDGRSLLNGQIAGYATSATDATLIAETATNPALSTKTGFKNLVGYNVKAGANYNINEMHNVFFNVGYYSKQPFLNAVYPNNKNYLNPNLTNEKIFGLELGYGFRSGIFNANLNLYRTQWKDRFLRRGGLTIDPDNNPATNNSISNAYSNISGITEIHQGIEIDANAKVHRLLDINAMFSLGDWHYDGNAIGNLFDETNQPIEVSSGSAGATTLYLDGVKVGGAAQTTAALGFAFKPIDWFTLDANYRYVNNLYANLNLLNFLTETAGQRGALKLPSYGLLDAGVSFKIKLNDPKQYFTLRGNVYNILDKTYIAESNTNNHVKQLTDFTATSTQTQQQLYDAYKANTNNFYKGIDTSNQVFFGFGRTWAATLSFNF